MNDADTEIADHLDKSANTWKISSPVALPIGGWDDFYERAAQRYPVRAFIQFTLPRKWREILGWKLKSLKRDIVWGFKHRYVKRHQYNVLRPKSLEPGYYDPDMRILHACMDELAQYFEDGAPNVDWQAEEEHQRVYNEMQAIYTWWTQEYPTREEKFEKQYPYPDVEMKRLFSDKHQEDPDVIESKRVSKLYHTAEEKWAQDEEDMLVRLMKIRRSLWYV